MSGEITECTTFFFIPLFSCSCLVYTDTIKLSFHLLEKKVLLIWTVMILNVASLCCMCSFVMQGIMLMPALRFKICMYL